MPATEQQIDAAHVAWETEAGHWKLERARGLQEWWIVIPQYPLDVTEDMEAADAIAFHRFEQKRLAQLFIRDKIIRAVLAAVEQ